MHLVLCAPLFLGLGDVMRVHARERHSEDSRINHDRFVALQRIASSFRCETELRMPRHSFDPCDVTSIAAASEAGVYRLETPLVGVYFGFGGYRSTAFFTTEVMFLS